MESPCTDLHPLTEGKGEILKNEDQPVLQNGREPVILILAINRIQRNITQIFKMVVHMKTYLERLSAYVATHPPDFSATNADSILEAIYWVYSESNNMDNAVIRADMESLYNALHGQPMREIGKVIDVVCRLCEEHKRAGFCEGVKIGFRLEKELTK